MKYQLIIFFSSLCTFTVVSQNPVNDTYKYDSEGYHNETRIDGSTRCQYTIKNGNLDGERNCYHPNGQLWIHETFDNGKFNGSNISLSDLGDTVFVEKYKRDTLVYTRNFEYYKNGSLKWITTIQYIDDSTLTENPFKIRKGLWRTSIDIRHTELTMSNKGWLVQYREDGSISDSIEITNGTYSGISATFFKSGKKMIAASQLDGEYHGVYFEYYENGQIKIETSYLEGKLNGKHLVYNESGEVLEESIYQLGKKNK